ncbi:MAG: DUF2971 domain-containing protein [Balneolaceae bacterium]|nr:DUF2971 domain-containing protein [Balneolaceae bacterium]
MGKVKYNVHPQSITAQRLDAPEIIDETRDEFQKLWEEMQSDVPETLYHYTSADGFLGIINSQSIWLTNIKYFEDHTEGMYGRKLLLDVIDELIEMDFDEKKQRFLNRIKKTVTNNWDDFYGKIYVSSFCKEGDVLSQWERFAQKGYCIGLDITKDTYLGYYTGSSHYALNPKITEIIYDRDKQKGLLEDVLNKCLELLETENVFPQDCNTLVLNQVIPWLFSFKNDFFKSEHEWRFITSIDWLASHKEMKSKSELLSFRVNDGAIIPYKSFRLFNDDSKYEGTLPLVEIIRGPKLDEYEANSIKSLLRKNRLPLVDINESKIPIR